LGWCRSFAGLLRVTSAFSAKPPRRQDNQALGEAAISLVWQIVRPNGRVKILASWRLGVLALNAVAEPTPSCRESRRDRNPTGNKIRGQLRFVT
jgi:hypothetical protein